MYQMKNIGPIKDVQLELNKLTLIFGRNNSGKTCAVNSVYCYHRFLHGKIADGVVEYFVDNNRDGLLRIENEALLSIISGIVENYDASFLDILAEKNRFFVDMKSIFCKKKTAVCAKEKAAEGTLVAESNDGVKCECAIDPKGIEVRCEGGEIDKEVCSALIGSAVGFVLAGHASRPVMVSAERAGISLFYKDINSLLRIVEQRSKDGTCTLDGQDVVNAIKSNMLLYNAAVDDNINFMKASVEIKHKRKGSRDFLSVVLSDIDQLLEGALRSDGKEVYAEFGGKKVGIGSCSSSFRSLALLRQYLELTVVPSGLVIVDEPEISLHPEYQRRLARILVALANAGVSVIVTTHSDYIMREMNISMALNNPGDDVAKIRKKYGYREDQTISYKDVSIYEFDGGVSTPVPVGKNGASIEAMDSVIRNMMSIYSDIECLG